MCSPKSAEPPLKRKYFFWVFYVQLHRHPPRITTPNSLCLRPPSLLFSPFPDGRRGWMQGCTHTARFTPHLTALRVCRNSAHHPVFPAVNTYDSQVYSPIATTHGKPTVFAPFLRSSAFSSAGCGPVRSTHIAFCVIAFFWTFRHRFLLGFSPRVFYFNMASFRSRVLVFIIAPSRRFPFFVLVFKLLSGLQHLESLSAWFFLYPSVLLPSDRFHRVLPLQRCFCWSRSV